MARWLKVRLFVLTRSTLEGRRISFARAPMCWFGVRAEITGLGRSVAPIILSAQIIQNEFMPLRVFLTWTHESEGFCSGTVTGITGTVWGEPQRLRHPRFQLFKPKGK